MSGVLFLHGESWDFAGNKNGIGVSRTSEEKRQIRLHMYRLRYHRAEIDLSIGCEIESTKDCCRRA